MLTAEEARRHTKLAEADLYDWWLRTVEAAISEAIDAGKYHTAINVSGLNATQQESMATELRSYDYTVHSDTITQRLEIRWIR